jgi:TPR repeat protein
MLPKYTTIFKSPRYHLTHRFITATEFNMSTRHRHLEDILLISVAALVGGIQALLLLDPRGPGRLNLSPEEFTVFFTGGGIGACLMLLLVCRQTVSLKEFLAWFFGSAILIYLLIFSFAYFFNSSSARVSHKTAIYLSMFISNIVFFIVAWQPDKKNKNILSQIEKINIVSHGLSFEEIKIQAEQGDSEAQGMLAECYRIGRGVERNPQEAVKWFQRSADQLNGRAQCSLGLMYQQGDGIRQNNAKAMLYYKQAALQGIAPALSNIGAMYELGYGVSKNNKEAIKWYEKAVDKGSTNALFYLASMYERGAGGANKTEEALRLCKLGAEKGDVRCQAKLGIWYSTGTVTNKDDAEAIRWYRLAAAQGEVIAQHLLGVMYEAGVDGPPDYEEAKKWYRIAAENGRKDSLKNLEDIERRGK